MTCPARRSTVALWHGTDLYRTGSVLPNLNPPFLSLILAPFGLLPVLPSYWLFTGLTVLVVTWSVLAAAGVWDSINSTVDTGLQGGDSSSFQIQDYLGTGRVLGFTVLVAAVDVVLLTAAATLGAFLYNMAAALLGGVEVTLAED